MDKILLELATVVKLNCDLHRDRLECQRGLPKPDIVIIYRSHDHKEP